MFKKVTSLSEPTTQNLVPDTFDGWLIIVGIHGFEHAPQLAHEFGVVLAHAKSKLHANGLHA